MLEDYKFNLSNIGSVRFSPFINPLLFSYSGSNGLSYRQDFRYNRLSGAISCSALSLDWGITSPGKSSIGD